ncbi:uncharacterized protein RHO17_003169 [Thomomys bottae]
MSEKQEPGFSNENSHVNVSLMLKGNGEHLNNDDFTRKFTDGSSLGQGNTLHLQDVLQKEASSDDDINDHQNKEDESGFSDSDPEDNVSIIIGKITINPAILKQMLLNCQTRQNLGASTSVSTINTTTEEEEKENASPTSAYLHE